MTTYTDRQKACIEALQDAVADETGVRISLDEAEAILAYMESTSPITDCDAVLYEHEDGRYAVAPSDEAATFTSGDPKWHRVGPVTLHGCASPVAGFSDATQGAGTLTDGTPLAIVREVYEKFAADDPKWPPSYSEGALDALDIVEQRMLDASQPAAPAETDYAALEREHLGDPDKRTGIYAPRDAAPSTAAQGATLTDEQQAQIDGCEMYFHGALVREMSELSDRNSPDDDPDAMIADASEMAGCIGRALERCNYVIVPRALLAAAKPVSVQGCAPVYCSCPSDECDMETLGSHGSSRCARQPVSVDAQAAAVGVPQEQNLVGAELALFRHTVEQFDDCNETSTSFDDLMKWANLGLLECMHFTVTEAGKALLESSGETK
jgi:hypothetical protein